MEKRTNDCEDTEFIVPAIILTARRLRNFFNENLKPLKIGAEQAGILFILEQKGQLNITDLSHITLKDKGTISRTIESLVQKKLVEKIQEKCDNRIIKIKITSEGINKAKLVKEKNEEYTQLFSTILTNTEKKDLNKILFKISEAIK